MSHARASTVLGLHAFALSVLMSSPAGAQRDGGDRVWEAPYSPSRIEWLVVYLNTLHGDHCKDDGLHVRFDGVPGMPLSLTIEGTRKKVEGESQRCTVELLHEVQLQSRWMQVPPPRVTVDILVSDAPDMKSRFWSKGSFSCSPKALPRKWSVQKDRSSPPTLDSICPERTGGEGKPPQNKQ